MSTDIIMRYCSYCKKDFGCIIGSVFRRCSTCDVNYAGKYCYKDFAQETSHGICTKECFLVNIRLTAPDLVAHIEKSLTK